jgi:hypothetical protein
MERSVMQGRGSPRREAGFRFAPSGLRGLRRITRIPGRPRQRYAPRRQTRRVSVEHARERPHRGEARASKTPRSVVLAVGESTNSGPSDSIERAREERLRDRVVVRDQRPCLRRGAPSRPSRKPTTRPTRAAT